MNIGNIEELGYDDSIKGHCFSNNKSSIDYDSLELLFLYIHHYKVFTNVPINLNGRYEFVYDNTTNLLTINKNESFVDLYGEDINLKVFCGKNGTGKTTIIDIIRDIDLLKEKECFIVLKDKNNKFITNNRNLKINYLNSKFKICKNKIDSSFNISSLSLSKNKQKNVVFNTERKIIHNYMLYPKFYSIWHTKFLFDGFEIRFWKFKEKVNNIAGKALKTIAKTFDDIFIDDLYEYFTLNPAQYIFLTKANEDFWEQFGCKNIAKYEKSYQFEIEGYIQATFFNFWRELRLSNQDYKDFNLSFLFIMYNYHYFALKNPEIRNEAFNILKDINMKHYPFTAYQLNKKEYLEVSEEFENIAKQVIKLTLGFPMFFDDCMPLMYDNIMIELFYLKPFVDINGERIYFENLSDGEYSKIKMITDLITVIYDEGKERTILLNDEIEAHLHPSWTQNYIHDYIEAIKYNNTYISKKRKGNGNKKLNIIITTHSPFILSEVTNDYIEYLERDGFNSKLKSKTNINNTFAGNVLQMFADNFFLNSTMGKYSKEILKEIISFLNHEEIKKPIVLKNDYTDCQKTQICKNIIESVGDSILKQMLKEKFMRFLEDEKNCY